MAKKDNRKSDDGEMAKKLTPESKQGSFTTSMLSDDQKKTYEAFLKRKPVLQNSRKNHYGSDIDQIWAEADRDYIPHRLGAKTKKAIAVDETKGWRSQKINLGDSNWQSDLSQSNPFVKIQTALSILIEQNPSGVFSATSRRYEATSSIMKQLYERSWEYAKSKAQLKLFVFNIAKYGWGVARTFPLRITRKVKNIVEYDEKDPSSSKYEEKEVVVYNDIMRENLDPRNVWVDDQAKPNNSRSLNDWVYRKVYSYDEAKELYGYSKLWDYVRRGGNTAETINNSNTSNATYSSEVSKNTENADLVEAYFYENLRDDTLIVEIGGVPVCIEPLPVSDASGLKKLSLWQAYWNLRHAESLYGIGIYEAIRFDQAFLDRIRNMTVDQITMSIYKMFFYQGTQSLTDTGDIVIRPGVGKQVLDPKNVNWLEIPGPGKDAYLGIDMFRKDVDEVSGITDPLLGTVTGKTAFEIAQSKEAALKRLKNPLDNILEALNDEGYLTVSLIQLLYSIPETYEISDPYLIADYLKEIQSDPELYDRSVSLDEVGQEKQSFTAKVYREFPMNLDKDEKGNLVETNDSRFFRVKPKYLNWEGVINIKSQSLLSSSKQVDKALEIEMYNLLIPILQGMAQERAMMIQGGQPAKIDNLTTGKTAKAIVKLYDKDPRDIFPDDWLSEQQPQPSLFLNSNGPAGPGSSTPSNPQDLMTQPGQPQAQQAQTAIPSTNPPANPTSMSGKIMSRLSAPFR